MGGETTKVKTDLLYSQTYKTKEFFFLLQKKMKKSPFPATARSAPRGFQGSFPLFWCCSPFPRPVTIVFKHSWGAPLLTKMMMLTQCHAAVGARASAAPARGSSSCALAHSGSRQAAVGRRDTVSAGGGDGTGGGAGFARLQMQGAAAVGAGGGRHRRGCVIVAVVRDSGDAPSPADAARRGRGGGRGGTHPTPLNPKP